MYTYTARLLNVSKSKVSFSVNVFTPGSSTVYSNFVNAPVPNVSLSAKGLAELFVLVNCSKIIHSYCMEKITHSVQNLRF